MLRATLKSLFARKVRLFLSALAVVLGVSFVTGTFVLTDTLNRTFDDLFAGINENVDVAVRTTNAVDASSDVDRAPVPSSLIATIEAVDGVEAAVGEVNGQAVLVDPETGEAFDTGGAPGVGTNYTAGTPTSSMEIVEPGRAPNGAEVVVDKSTADDLGLQLGQQISVLTREPGTFTLVGTFTVAGKDSVGGAAVAAFDTATAQRILLQPDQFSSINVAAAGDLSQSEVRTRVAAVLPAGVEAITGEQLTEENADVIQEAVSGLSTFLLVFAAIAVFVGAFIIFNTFTMLVAQRVRELALLRAVGASRRQVQVSVQVEAAIIGFVGAVAGLVLGGFLAVGLRALTAASGIKLPEGSLVFLPRTIIVALAVGLVVTGVAAFVPARKAAKVPPVAAMRETYVLPTRSLRLRGVGGVALTAIGGLLMVLGLASTGSRAAATVGAGAVGVFLGVATLSPLLSPVVTGALGKPLPALFGATGRIGRQNAMRNPRRTASTASALMIGLAVVSACSVLGESIKVSVRETVSSSLGADFYLSPSSFGQGFSGEVARSLAGRPGVEAVTGLRFGMVDVDGENAGVSAGEPSALESLLAIDGVEGAVNTLGDGSIIVDTDEAAERGFAVGEKIPVVFPNGPTELTLVGTYEPNDIAGSYLVALSEWTRHSTGDLDQIVLVKIAPGADPAAVRMTIDEATKSFPNIEVRDQTEFIAEQEQQIDTLLNMIYVLLTLTVLIAMFGIVNTLALSVIERTREIGLLRAIGMTRGQLRMMVRLEAVVIAVFGALLGVVVGSYFGWALVSALESEGITTFAYPTDNIIIVVIVGAILGVVAAIFPARRAARMDVLRAIATT